MHQDSPPPPPGTQGRQPGKPEEGTLRAVTRQENRQSARQTLTQPKDARERVSHILRMGGPPSQTAMRSQTNARLTEYGWKPYREC